MTVFSCIIFLKICTMVSNFKFIPYFQYTAKFRLKCTKTKTVLYPELFLTKKGVTITCVFEKNLSNEILACTLTHRAVSVFTLERYFYLKGIYLCTVLWIQTLTLALHAIFTSLNKVLFFLAINQGYGIEINITVWHCTVCNCKNTLVKIRSVNVVVNNWFK